MDDIIRIRTVYFVDIFRYTQGPLNDNDLYISNHPQPKDRIDPPYPHVKAIQEPV